MTDIHELTDPLVLEPGEGSPEPEDRLGLCLSGGGYRAMLFHCGVLWRLCETGWLTRVDEVSSVSGGSITAAVLATEWQALVSAEDPLVEYSDRVVRRVRALASITIDRPSVITGTLAPFTTIGRQVEAELREHLLGDSQLADLPESPRFFFHATNISTGKLVRFSRDAIADYKIGWVPDPDLALAAVVAASGAFPPFLSPYRLDTGNMNWQDEPGNYDDPRPFREELFLTDGGVYDNLGLETAWKHCHRVLVSDGGGALSPDADPAVDWAQQTVRIMHVLDHQVRSLRQRQVIASFKAGRRTGAFMSIRTPLSDFDDLPGTLLAPDDITRELAGIKTRLKRISDEDQERLINWGYVIADANLRAYLDPQATPAPSFPYEGGVS